jgi:hypothetical protein
MTTIDTPDTLATLPSWQMGSSLRAADLNTLSAWQRWLHDAMDGLPASSLLRPAYRWDLVASGIVTRYYGSLALLHQYRYLIYRGWDPYSESAEGVKIATVQGWLPENEASLPEANGGWITVDLTQYDWMMVGLPYHIHNARYAMESDQPYEF